MLVGDTRGRVHSWSVTDVSGRSVADHWLRDDTAETCTKYRVRSSLTERRHHCRNCGHVFCSRYDVFFFNLFKIDLMLIFDEKNRCSRYESEIMQLRIRRPYGLKMSSDGTS